MGGKASRDKGARSERALRDELIRHGWSDVRRVPLSGAVKTSEAYQDDVVGRPAGFGQEIRFENKARATGFDAYYALVPAGVDRLCFAVGHELFVVTLDPNKALESASFPDVTTFDPKTQKAMRSLAKKCQDWAGNAQIVSLKQDRKPFLYCRYRKWVKSTCALNTKKKLPPLTRITTAIIALGVVLGVLWVSWDFPQENG
jgi:hypothetical protein